MTQSPWINCQSCSVEFSIATVLYNNRKRDGLTYCCPNGHSNSFRPSETDRLKEQIEALCADLETARLRTQRAERALRANGIKVKK